MTRKGNTWVANGEAEPGKISYKYIVDGIWITDPGNNDTEIDGQNTNSVKMVDK